MRMRFASNEGGLNAGFTPQQALSKLRILIIDQLTSNVATSRMTSIGEVACPASQSSEPELPASLRL